jgi:cysteine-S-conjugate beta-lyase
MTTNFDQVINRRGTDSVKWQWYGDAIPMWVADMEFPAPEPVIAALAARVAHGIYGYANEPPQLREVLQAWLVRRFDWRVPADALVFTPGVVSAFNIACRALCAPGDGVLVQAPVYPPMRTAPANYAAVRDEMELTRGQDGRYFVDYGLMDATISERTKLFLLCNPHNPTGRVFDLEELMRMAEVSLAKGLVICSDEIHCDLVYAPYRHIPIASLDPEIARRSVTIMAPSKTFNIPGLGFSFAIIEDPELRKRYMAAGRDIVPHINVMGYAGALAAYTEGEPWLAECTEYLQANRDFLAQFVAERLRGVKMALPEATYLAWLDFAGAELGEDPFKFFLERAGVALNEGAPFGPGSEGFARLNFGCPRSQLVQALERMENALRSAGVEGPNA